MAVKICECIGICKVDRNGSIIELQREFFGQGWIFKDWKAFHEHPNEPCYVPELSDTVYMRDDFMSLCNNQEEIAEKLFYEVDWQSPSALMYEWETDGEINTCGQCGKIILTYDVHKCPHCGCSISDNDLSSAEKQHSWSCNK